MKKHLIKVAFLMRPQIAGKEYEINGTKYLLVEAENYDTAKGLVQNAMGKSHCNYVLGSSPKDNKKILRTYKALEQFSNAASELSAAWIELDDREEVEEDMTKLLTRHFPHKAIRLSFDEFAYDINEWNRKVQNT